MGSGMTKQQRYSEAQIDKCLMAIAYHGQVRAAYQELKLGGMDPLPGESTLRDWRHKYSGRIAQLVEEYGEDIQRHRVAGYMDIISTSQDAVQLSIEKATEAVQAAEDARMITALSGAARNFATIYGITQDKVNVHYGKPTSIVGKEKETEEALRGLAQRFQHDVDSTVEQPRELES